MRPVDDAGVDHHERGYFAMHGLNIALQAPGNFAE